MNRRLSSGELRLNSNEAASMAVHISLKTIVFIFTIFRKFPKKEEKTENGV